MRHLPFNKSSSAIFLLMCCALLFFISVDENNPYEVCDLNFSVGLAVKRSATEFYLICYVFSALTPSFPLN